MCSCDYEKKYNRLRSSFDVKKCDFEDALIILEEEKGSADDVMLVNPSMVLIENQYYWRAMRILRSCAK